MTNMKSSISSSKKKEYKQTKSVTDRLTKLIRWWRSASLAPQKLYTYIFDCSGEDDRRYCVSQSPLRQIPRTTTTTQPCPFIASLQTIR